MSMMDGWDFMIAGADAEVEAEIAGDLKAYTKHLAAADTDACIKIEKKYGLFGLPPQIVTEQLAEMATPMRGG